MLLQNRIIGFVLAVAFLFTSCRKKEIAIEPFDRGDVITASVDMSSDYKHQVFYSLSQDTIVSTNLKTDWDLAFENGATGYHVKLNSAKAMYAYNTGQTTFSLVTDTSGFGTNKKCDSPTGNLDSTAFNGWESSFPVFVLDRGYSSSGIHQGFKKIQLLSSGVSDYSYKVAELNGAGEVTVSVPKNNAKNFSCLSLNTNQVVNVEPDKENYDLLFTQYTHVYSNPYSTYLVTGVLINPDKVKVAAINDKPFSEIELNDTIQHPFSSFQNAIGYDWKFYDLPNSVYIVYPSKCYIIKDVQGYFYKLHFIDFYNQSGQKGAPKWEYKRL